MDVFQLKIINHCINKSNWLKSHWEKTLPYNGFTVNFHGKIKEEELPVNILPVYWLLCTLVRITDIPNYKNLII